MHNYAVNKVLCETGSPDISYKIYFAQRNTTNGGYIMEFFVRDIEDVKKLEETPWPQVTSANNAYELLKEVADRKPDATALTFLPTAALDEDPVIFTHRQLFENITRAANMFYDLAGEKGQCVSFLLPHLPQSHFTFWGAQASGIANPINFLLNPDQIADLLIAAETKVLVALGPHPTVDIWDKVQAIRERIPTLKAILTVGGKPDEEDGVYDFDEMLSRYPSDKLNSGYDFSREDIATYFHTGGTTGSPKLAPHTQGNNVYATWAVKKMWGYEEDTIVINPLPLFHVAGSIIASLANFCSGGHLIIPSPAGFRNPLFNKNYWKLVERYRPTHMATMPTSMVALLNVPLENEDISCLKYCITGGTPMPREVHLGFESAFGIKVLEMYGMTEAGSIVALNVSHGPAYVGSAGLRLPYEQMRIAKVNSDGTPGEICQTGETGVVMLKGPNIFPGYKDPRQNKGTLTDDGWLITGDLGHLDECDRVYLTGRSKDLIIRSGHNIDPSIIEEALSAHPEVAMVAAVGRPDTYAGELPVGYVQLKPDATVTSDELLKFVKENISERPAMPKEIVITPEMPVTAVGKIFKPRIKWDEAAMEFTRALAPLAEKNITATVTVGEDKRYGTLNTVTLSAPADADRAAIEAEVKSIMGAYTFMQLEIKWG